MLASFIQIVKQIHCTNSENGLTDIDMDSISTNLYSIQSEISHWNNKQNKNNELNNLMLSINEIKHTEKRKIFK